MIACSPVTAHTVFDLARIDDAPSPAGLIKIAEIDERSNRTIVSKNRI
jgi:hypothetical protein